MTANTAPSVSWEYKTLDGKILRLSSDRLYSFLHSLWLRLGGSVDTPDLAGLLEQIETINTELDNQAGQLAALADSLVEGLNDLQDQINVHEAEINALELDVDQAYSLIDDVAQQNVSLADELHEGLDNLQSQITTQTTNTTVDLDQVYSILTDMNTATAALADFVQGDV